MAFGGAHSRVFYLNRVGTNGCAILIERGMLERATSFHVTCVSPLADLFLNS